MGQVKEECVFLFLFQPFTCKAYFPALSLEEKNEVAQMESGPGQVDTDSSCLCPTSFLWQVLGCSSRLKLTPLGQGEQDTDESSAKKTSRPSFLQNCTSSLLWKTLLEAGKNCVQYVWAKKRQYIFHRSQIVSQKFTVKSDAQEIKLFSVIES